MAWIAAVILSIAAFFGWLLPLDSAGRTEYQVSLAVRDSIARIEPNWTRVMDSAKALHKSGASYADMDRYISGEGFQDTSFRKPPMAEIRKARLLKWGLGYPMGALTILLPLGMFVATWIWFGARAQASSGSFSSAS